MAHLITLPGFDFAYARCPWCNKPFEDEQTLALRTAYDRQHGGLKIEVWHNECAAVVDSAKPKP